MPQRLLSNAIDELDRLAEDGGTWKPLLDELPGLRERIARLRELLERSAAPLVTLLFGGTGTGKSTLLNALAGACIAETGVTRPTTAQPTIYHPPEDGGRRFFDDFGPAKYIESHCLDDLILIDTPDTDSIETEHCERVTQLLERADVVVFCATQQKYKNEKSISLLRPVKNEHKIVCVQTRADEDADIRKDWSERLADEGVPAEHCFRVSAARALERKLDGATPRDGFEFAELDEYIKQKLPPERTSIKRRNLDGALANTLGYLLDKLEGKDTELKSLLDKLREAEEYVARRGLEQLQEHVLDEPHVWVVALGEGVSERAFGLVGTLYRIVHWVRVLPSRVTGGMSLTGLLRPGRHAPGPDAPSSSLPSERDDYLRLLAAGFSGKHAEAGAYMARAGFDATDFEEWQDAFVTELRARLGDYLAPIQERLGRRSRHIARWVLPVLEALWFVPFAFTVTVPIGRYLWNLARYARVVLPDPGFLTQSAAMLATIVVIELALFTYFIRSAGRGLRKRSKQDLAKGLGKGGFGFGRERAQVQKTLGRLVELEALREESCEL